MQHVVSTLHKTEMIDNKEILGTQLNEKSTKLWMLKLSQMLSTLEQHPDQMHVNTDDQGWAQPQHCGTQRKEEMETWEGQRGTGAFHASVRLCFAEENKKEILQRPVKTSAISWGGSGYGQ